MIPGEAVEAAARVMLACQEFGGTMGGWSGLDETERQTLLEDAQKVLEAAAPHMLAAAKVSALEEMAADVGLRIDQIEAHQVPESEYGTLFAQREEAVSIYRDIRARAATYRPTP